MVTQGALLFQMLHPQFSYSTPKQHNFSAKQHRKTNI